MNVEGACSTSGNRALHTRLTERMLPATSGVQASSGADCCVRHCAERGRRNACSVHKGNISAQQTSSMLLPGEEAAPAHPPRADACRTTHVHGPYYARMHDGRTDAARVARRETTSAPLACLLPSSQSPPHFVSVALAARHGGRWAAAVGPGRTRLSSAAPLAAERPAGVSCAFPRLCRTKTYFACWPLAAAVHVTTSARTRAPAIARRMEIRSTGVLSAASHRALLR